MRTTQTCPKCRGRKFYVQPRFRLPDPSAGNTTFVVPAATVQVPGTFFGDRAEFGTIEAWTCAACGFTEFYATPAYLAAAAQRNPDQVRVVDAAPAPQGPFR